MLGWEYPPHITGGLATACLGLCEGLHRAGVEVTFLVPRAFGDEDARFAKVIGADQVWVEAEGADRGPRSAAPQRTPATPPRGEAPSAVEEQAAPHSFVLRDPRDAPASSYFDAEQFEIWVREAARAARTREAGLAARSERPNSLALEAALPVEPRPAPRRERLHFRGAYSEDLFDEVARFARCAAQLASEGGFDVVHAHDWMTFPAGVLAARAAEAPLVAHVHASEYDRSGDSPDERIRSLEQMGVDAAARVVCVSHYTASVLRRRYSVDEARLRVVHNAVTRKEQSERIRAGKSIPEPIVLFLGRVTFQKGPDYFLEAAARVVALEPNVKFVMVGAGDMLPKMVERAARMGLARHVHFTGFLKGPDVERIYSMADVYVMPSVSEPFGISPLEALALDTPVIVSRQSGVSEVLSNALKVDFWDVEEIANKILALLRYPALRRHVCDAGGGEVRAMSWADRGARLRGVYSELLGRESKAAAALADETGAVRAE